MKKALLSLALLVTSSIAIAQVTVSPGIKAGINKSNISDMEGTSSKTGFHAGLFVNLDLASFYELQVETTYSNQGAKVKNYSLDNYQGDVIINENGTSDLNLDYLSIGIANKFFIVKDLGVHFIVGPTIDILLKDDFGDSTPIDFSFFGGVGYEFPFGLAIEARYKQGIIDLDDGLTTFGSENTEYDKNYLNGVLQLGVAYKFDFRK
ncbi:porin family protein [Oceanihabitans sediminis]|uniref:PorT family protein n=1 Tax=Oceanihabitans sediminis TaxID=1812012 RepID=A0A368P5Q3_9FLAO|nr:porin family protein [Oceanihabitans sediminis]MDX1278647.1 porin family protein [Oceanihabitans sediminis]MDX1772875.1 porin family protein [Oceanihabitans sediminis]RBP34553.1 outer membrane protein with beta-barrel domain [Oceanihabitans sediminis]RCU58217.1 PorT family protein [Oceanihabitans sediminis]